MHLQLVTKLSRLLDHGKIFTECLANPVFYLAHIPMHKYVVVFKHMKEIQAASHLFIILSNPPLIVPPHATDLLICTSYIQRLEFQFDNRSNDTLQFYFKYQ